MWWDIVEYMEYVWCKYHTNRRKFSTLRHIKILFSMTKMYSWCTYLFFSSIQWYLISIVLSPSFTCRMTTVMSLLICLRFQQLHHAFRWFWILAWQQPTFQPKGNGKCAGIWGGNDGLVRLLVMVMFDTTPKCNLLLHMFFQWSWFLLLLRGWM